MKTQNNTWKQISIPFNEDLKDALQQQHHAAQFIALVGKHLIPNNADDSNTNMEFVFDEDILLGNPLPSGFRLALRLNDLKLLILDNGNNSKKEISLDGKSKEEVFDELKKSLIALGVDVSNFTNKLHYEIPEHQLNKGAVFSLKNKASFIENSIYRNNAEIVLNKIAPLINNEESIRIWPHHFDTGAYFVLSQNEKGEASQSLGIGWAIPDDMVDEPYYYLSFWSEKPIEGFDTFPALKEGQWLMPNWNGAVLRQSEIILQKTAIDQSGIVESFFRHGLEIVLNQLKTS